nr:MAG TPA: hypothetical protein [Caudoviricetes sp.]
MVVERQKKLLRIPYDDSKSKGRNNEQSAAKQYL